MTPAAFSKTRRWVETSLGRIAVYEQGEGPAAVFVHGYPLSAYFWRHQFDALADTRRCIAVDLLGLGHTEPKPGTSVAYESQADMVQEVCTQLDLQRFDLVGNDSGGSIAQLVATRDPARIRSLTLTNCEVAENYLPEPLVPIVGLARTGQLPELFESIVGNLDGARQSLASVFARPEEAITLERLEYEFAPLVSSPARKEWLCAYLTSLGPEVNAALVPELQRFDRPTLVVWGDADPYMPLEWAHWLEKQVPGVRRVVVIPDGRLFFPEEEHARFSDALRQFWTDVDR